jgi:hypothetical protein
MSPMTAYSGSDREHREGCRDQDAAPNDDYKYAAKSSAAIGA